MSICKEKGDKDDKEEKEDKTRLKKKVRRLEADLGYSNLTVNDTLHSSYQRIHQSWHADDDDDQILRKYRKKHLPGILPPGGFRAPASSREADISSSGILPAEPLQLGWKPVPWTRSTHSPRQHPDVSSGVEATPPSGSEDGKVRPTKESTAKDLRTKGDDDVGADLESNQKSSGGLGSEAEIQRVDVGGVTTYESGTGRRVLVLRKSHSRHRPGCCRPLLSPTNPLRTSIGVISLMNHAQGSKNEKNGLRPVPKVMIVGSGTFNPVHKLHIRRFNLARVFLEDHKGMRVVGGIVSPSHATLVRQRHRVHAAEIIPPKHRLFMARAAIGEGSWLVVDPWELTRRRAMDYLSVLEHVKGVYHDTFPGSADDITILYMCPASQVHYLNPAMLREGGFGIITICRPLEKERLLKELSPRFQNLAIIVEDSTILTAKHEKISSAMVRQLLKDGKPVEGLVGKAVARYMKDNYIAEGISGKHKWTREDNVFMFEDEDKRDRPYHNLPRVYVRPASQIPLQY